MDEWAAQLKLDPLEFRLRNITDERLRRRLQSFLDRYEAWLG